MATTYELIAERRRAALERALSSARSIDGSFLEVGDLFFGLVEPLSGDPEDAWLAAHEGCERLVREDLWSLWEAFEELRFRKTDLPLKAPVEAWEPLLDFIRDAWPPRLRPMFALQSEANGEELAKRLHEIARQVSTLSEWRGQFGGRVRFAEWLVTHLEAKVPVDAGSRAAGLGKSDAAELVEALSEAQRALKAPWIQEGLKELPRVMAELADLRPVLGLPRAACTPAQQPRQRADVVAPAAGKGAEGEHPEAAKVASERETLDAARREQEARAKALDEERARFERERREVEAEREAKRRAEELAGARQEAAERARIQADAEAREAASAQAAGKGEGGGPVPRALGVLMQRRVLVEQDRERLRREPHYLSLSSIAKAASCARSTLQRSRRFREAHKVACAPTSAPPRGSKTADGDLESWEDE